jgi:large subunit ribosomal protein L4
MDHKVTTLDGKAAGSVALRTRSSARAARRHPAAHGALAALQAPGRHAQDQDRGEISHDARRYKQKGTGGARHGAKSAPQFRGGGKAFGPVVRSHAHDLPKKVRALALKHALSDKAKGEKLIVIADAAVKEPRPRRWRAVRKLGSPTR